ncbi:hypothetical protein MLD38_011483 [Melastoma candidum]|uniref:Uncharacterized protein n=1 Tax=Melastoma candidum TaxID=119954 RepID=A0ACB9R376_9MYRT|nr:hypothetical protein MLD38_011483 [Melastoma candidum]
MVVPKIAERSFNMCFESTPTFHQRLQSRRSHYRFKYEPAHTKVTTQELCSGKTLDKTLEVGILEVD